MAAQFLLRGVEVHNFAVGIQVRRESHLLARAGNGVTDAALASIDGHCGGRGCLSALAGELQLHGLVIGKDDAHRGRGGDDENSEFSDGGHIVLV